jgi:hypothetical protein
VSNTTDITNCTDRVLDIFLRTKGGEDNVNCEILTVTERRQLADLMGWKPSTFLSSWIAAAPADRTEPDADTRDYEGMILDRQDAEVGGYL